MMAVAGQSRSEQLAARRCIPYIDPAALPVQLKRTWVGKPDSDP